MGLTSTRIIFSSRLHVSFQLNFLLRQKEIEEWGRNLFTANSALIYIWIKKEKALYKSVAKIEPPVTSSNSIWVSYVLKSLWVIQKSWFTEAMSLKGSGLAALFIFRLRFAGPSVTRLCGQRLWRSSSGASVSNQTNSLQLTRRGCCVTFYVWQYVEGYVRNTELFTKFVII